MTSAMTATTMMMTKATTRATEAKKSAATSTTTKKTPLRRWWQLNGDYDTQHENLDDDINSGDENWAHKMAMILITLAEIKKPDDYQGNSQDYVTPTARWWFAGFRWRSYYESGLAYRKSGDAEPFLHDYNQRRKPRRRNHKIGKWRHGAPLNGPSASSGKSSLVLFSFLGPSSFLCSLVCPCFKVKVYFRRYRHVNG